MSKLSKYYRGSIGAGLLVTILIMAVGAYFIHGYLYGSYLIYSLYDSTARNNLRIVPEERVLENTDAPKSGIVLSGFGYEVDIPWDDVRMRSSIESVAWIAFHRKVVVLIENPQLYVSTRQALSEKDGAKKQISPMDFIDYSFTQMTEFEFISKSLFTTPEDLRLFSSITEAYPIVMCLGNKFMLAGAKRHLQKLYAFQTERYPGFKINNSTDEGMQIHTVLIFPTSEKVVTLTIAGYDPDLKQADVDYVIRSFRPSAKE